MPEDGDPRTTSTIAKERLSRIQRQLSLENSSSGPKEKKEDRASRRNPVDSSLPADWSDVLGQVKQLRAIANTPPASNPGYIRQKNAGKLWVRERIEQLLDPGSFYEVGSITGRIQWTASAVPGKDSIKSFTPSNNVQGRHPTQVSSSFILLTASVGRLWNDWRTQDSFYSR